MKHIYLIVEKSVDQKEFQAFFRKLLGEFGVDSPADLSDEQKKEFFNRIDKEFKSDAERAGKSEGVKESRDDFFSRMVRNRRLRKEVVESYAQKAALQEEEGDTDHGGAEDDEANGEKRNLVVEFPNEIRVEFVCKREDIEKVKTRAQELHDEGMDPTEVAQTVEEEFAGCTFQFDKPEGEDTKGNKTKSSDKKEEKKTTSEGMRFSDFIKGKSALDVMETSRDLKEDKEVISRAHAYLERISNDVSSFVSILENSNRATKARLLKQVYEAQEDISIINRVESLTERKG